MFRWLFGKEIEQTVATQPEPAETFVACANYPKYRQIALCVGSKKYYAMMNAEHYKQASKMKDFRLDAFVFSGGETAQALFYSFDGIPQFAFVCDAEPDEQDTQPEPTDENAASNN